MAVGAIRAIQDHGLRVPQDIAVAGYDGIALGRYTVPRLTTIRQNTTVLAERAADILLRCIEENAPARHETVPLSWSRARAYNNRPGARLVGLRVIFMRVYACALSGVAMPVRSAKRRSVSSFRYFSSG